MTIKVTVERKCVKPEFKIGTLVELDLEQFPKSGGYVVLVTNDVGEHFSGTVIQSNMTGDFEFQVGAHSNSLIKGAFVKFSGKVTMEQE